MTSPFQVVFSRSISQVSHEVQLDTIATSALIENTSPSGVNVFLSTAGAALLTGAALAPGDSTTVQLAQANGGVNILSAVASGAEATIQVTMTPVTDSFGGLTILQPGTPTEQPPS